MSSSTSHPALKRSASNMPIMHPALKRSASDMPIMHPAIKRLKRAPTDASSPPNGPPRKSNNTWTFDPEYLEAVKGLSTTMPTVPSTTSTFRFLVDMAYHDAFTRIPCVERFLVHEDILACHAMDGAALSLYRFTPCLYDVHANPAVQPLHADPDKPAILYLHGGGYVAGSVGLFRREIMRYAYQTKITVFAVAYRLAPEHPFPAALQDVLGALRHLHQNAHELAINPQRIGVVGVHAGGGLAVAAALAVRSWGLKDAIKRMVLVSPVLDSNGRTEKLPGLSRMLTWTAAVNRAAWKAYVGGRALEKEKNAKDLAMPGTAKDLTGLPLMYIDCGELDRSVGACMDFVERCKAQGGTAVLRIYPGMPFGWDWEAPDTEAARRATKMRVRMLKML